MIFDDSVHTENTLSISTPNNTKELATISTVHKHIKITQLLEE